MSASGEFRFTLIEKTDRNGETYLFAGVKMLNAVLFIRKDVAVPGRPQRWKAVLKPYEKPGEAELDPHASVWDDNDPYQGDSDDERPAQERKRPKAR